jgi:hypothetical protein
LPQARESRERMTVKAAQAGEKRKATYHAIVNNQNRWS